MGACKDVLKSDGRIAGYTIHTRPRLTPSELERAVELGPSEVLADGSPAEQCEETGFRVVSVEDVTTEFRTTCETILREWSSLEAELRAEDGDEVFEEEMRKKSNMVAGVDKGLLARSLVVSQKV